MEEHLFKHRFSLTVISNMEVPRRPQPSSFTLALRKPASSAPSPLGAVEKVDKKDPMTEKLQEQSDGTAERDPLGEETFSAEEESLVSVTVEPPELEDTNTSAEEANLKLSSQDSFSEDSSMLEERLLQEEEEAKKKSEEEEAAAKERAAQRQLLAIEELVHSERNYLRLLQVSTVTIRSNLQKLQVCSIY